jgi:hypothetical protein
VNSRLRRGGRRSRRPRPPLRAPGGGPQDPAVMEARRSPPATTGNPSTDLAAEEDALHVDGNRPA